MAVQKEKKAQKDPKSTKTIEPFSGMDNSGYANPNEVMRGILKAVPKKLEEEPKDFEQEWAMEKEAQEDVPESKTGAPVKAYADEKLSETTDFADQYMRMAAKMALRAAGKFLSPFSSTAKQNRRDLG
ncbi:MAG: hypothetical protein V1909_04600 [Candidatus Micrarchaeota archaeon]